MSDETAIRRSASHPIRIAIRMLVWASIAFVVLAPFSRVGGPFDLKRCAGPFLCAIAGALLGLCVDLFKRRGDERVWRDLSICGFACALFAALWLWATF